MRDPFQGYDQWKTASPYDDEPDIIEEAEGFIELYRDSTVPSENLAVAIIEALLAELR